MKYIKNTLVCLLFISIIFLPVNIISANNQRETEIEAYIYDTYGGSGELTINEEHMEAIRNAPKEGGIYPVEITIKENGLSATTTIYITVNPLKETSEEKEDELTTVPSTNNQTTSLDEETKNLDEKENILTYNTFAIKTEYYSGYSILEFLSFIFAMFLIVMFVVSFVLFKKLQVDVREEVEQLNSV